MKPITSSHLKLNQPYNGSQGYKNWWDVAGQNVTPSQQPIQLTPVPSFQQPFQQPFQQTLRPVQSLSSLQPTKQLAPSYGQYQPIAQVPTQFPMTTINQLPVAPRRGCGCNGAI